MISGYEKVLNILSGLSPERPPKGELLISEDFINDSPYPDINAFLEAINADLVTLPQNASQKHLIKYFSNQKLFIFGLFDGPFTAMVNTLGLTKTCYSIIKNPKETELFMRNFFHRHQKNKIFNAIQNGCHGLIIADDLAGNQGMLVSPKYLNNYYFPILNDLFYEINCKKIPVIFHSDGDIRDIFIPLKQCGFQGVQGLQPSVGINASCFDKEFFQNWILWGNFELETGPTFKTDKEVTLEIPQLLKNWSSHPGYIFGTSGGLYPGLPANIIKAAYDTVNLKLEF